MNCRFHLDRLTLAHLGEDGGHHLEAVLEDVGRVEPVDIAVVQRRPALGDEPCIRLREIALWDELTLRSLR